MSAQDSEAMQGSKSRQAGPHSVPWAMGLITKGDGPTVKENVPRFLGPLKV